MLFTEITAEEFAEIRAREAYGEGKAESQRNIALKLKSKGTSAADISEITGLSLDEIDSL